MQTPGKKKEKEEEKEGAVVCNETQAATQSQLYTLLISTSAADVHNTHSLFIGLFVLIYFALSNFDFSLCHAYTAPAPSLQRPNSRTQAKCFSLWLVIIKHL